jgi:hypothetical protein
MKSLYFTIPVGLMLAVAGTFAQYTPKDNDPTQHNKVPAPDDLTSLVKQLETIKAQKVQLEKQEKELVTKIRAKIEEQKKSIQAIESLLGGPQLPPTNESKNPGSESLIGVGSGIRSVISHDKPR